MRRTPGRPSRRTARLAAAGALGLLIAGLATLPAAGQGTPPAPTGTPSVSLTTRASGPVTRRGQISDTAILAGGAQPTGAITFRVYGPSDPACAAVPATISQATVTGDGTYTSAPYTTPVAGVYRFVARYGGDGPNPPVATPCGDPTETVTVTDPPPPVLGRSFQVGPLSGRIFVMVPAAPGRTRPAAGASAAAKGIGFEPLPESRTLPVGSVIDATVGVARITSAAGAAGHLQTGDFAAGVFQVRQTLTAHGLTELHLMVGRAALASCTPAATAAAAGRGASGHPGRARSAARRRLSAHVLAELRSTATGTFRTAGRFSAATVRGTGWDTIDRCDGTLTRVHRGVVVVTDFRRARSIVLRAGRSYLAAAP